MSRLLTAIALDIQDSRYNFLQHSNFATLLLRKS